MRSTLVGLAIATCACGGAAKRPADESQRVTPAVAAAAPASANTGADAPTEHIERAPSPLATDAASLPLAVEGLSASFDLAGYARLATENDPAMVLLGKDHYSAFWDPKDAKITRKYACFPKVIEKIKAVYEAAFLHPLAIKDAKLIHTTATVAEIEKCVATIGEKRAKPQPKDRRIVELQLTTLTQLPGPWILWTPNAKEAKAIGELLATASETPNPLAALMATQPSTTQWHASTYDYTWETLGVPSLGVIFEYDKKWTAGPFAMRLVFANAATAKLARERIFKLPDDLALQTAVGERVKEAIAILRGPRAKVVLDGREVVVRGSINENEWNDYPFVAFEALATPVRRPLTKDEASRLIRPLPAQRN